MSGCFKIVRLFIFLLSLSSCDSVLKKEESSVITNHLIDDAYIQRFTKDKMEDIRSLFVQYLRQSENSSEADFLAKVNLCINTNLYSVPNTYGCDCNFYRKSNNLSIFPKYNLDFIKKNRNLDQFLFDIQFKIIDYLFNISEIQTLLNQSFGSEKYHLASDKLFHYTYHTTLLKFQLIGYILANLNAEMISSDQSIYLKNYLENVEPHIKIANAPIFDFFKINEKTIKDNFLIGFQNKEKEFSSFCREAQVSIEELEFKLSEYKKSYNTTISSLKEEVVFEANSYKENLILFKSYIYFEDILSKGKSYMEKLEGVIKKTIGGQFPQEINEKNKREDSLFNMFYRLKSENESEEETKNYITNISSKNDKNATGRISRGCCSFSFNEDGLFVVKESKRDEQISLSCFIWNSYKIYKSEAVLKIIKRDNVINKHSMALINLALLGGKLEERFIDVKSDLGIALLGTPNGKSAVWLAHDHLEDIDYRVPNKIKVYSTYYSELKHRAYYMDIYFEKMENAP